MTTETPRVDNWAEDHKRKGTTLKKNTRRSAEEQFSQVNEQFDQYYRSQLAPLLEEGEWEVMEAVMRTALPVTFRLSGPADDAEAHALRDEMEARLVAPLLKHASDALQPPRPLPWYPQRLAWQFDVSRAALRGKGDQSSASDDLKRLHSWLLQDGPRPGAEAGGGEHGAAAAARRAAGPHGARHVREPGDRKSVV